MPTFSHLSRIWLRMSCAKPPRPLPDWPFWTAAQPYSACQNKRGTGGAAQNEAAIVSRRPPPPAKKMCDKLLSPWCHRPTMASVCPEQDVKASLSHHQRDVTGCRVNHVAQFRHDILCGL